MLLIKAIENIVFVEAIATSEDVYGEAIVNLPQRPK
jgi:hypothetical protein